MHRVYCCIPHVKLAWSAVQCCYYSRMSLYPVNMYISCVFTAFSDDHQLSDPSSASLSCPSVEKFRGDFLYFILSYMTVCCHSTFFSKAFLKHVVIAKMLLLQQVVKQWLCEGSRAPCNIYILQGARPLHSHKWCEWSGRSPCNIYLYNIPLLPKTVSCGKYVLLR